MMILMQLLF